MQDASIELILSLTKTESPGSNESGVRYMHKVPVLPERHQRLFWEKVDKSCECWNWIGGKFSNGYGMVRYNRKNFSAHRLSYAMAYGEVPSGKIVCHKCDNPSCVNPSHLFVGTYRDNIQDMIRKGRKANSSGEANGQAKLTEGQVKEIKIRYAEGNVSHNELAKEYNVSSALIGLITQGKVWANVDGPLTDGMSIRDKRPSKVKGERNANAKLKEQDIIAIRNRYAAGGITMRKLGEIFGICPQTVCSIVRKLKWKHVTA